MFEGGSHHGRLVEDGVGPIRRHENDVTGVLHEGAGVLGVVRPGARVPHGVDGVAGLLEPPALAAVEEGVEGIFMIVERRTGARGTHVDLHDIPRVPGPAFPRVDSPRDAVQGGVQRRRRPQYVKQPWH